MTERPGARHGPPYQTDAVRPRLPEQLRNRHRPGPSRCQDCGKLWSSSGLHEIKHLWERVNPGEPMPSGQCPECGALCQPSTPPPLPVHTVFVEVRGGLVSQVRATDPEMVHVVVADKDGCDQMDHVVVECATEDDLRWLGSM